MSFCRAVGLVRLGYCRPLVARFASGGPKMSESLRSQLHKSGGEQGFINYERNISRDPHADASEKPLKGDTPKTFMLRRLGHAYEVYPNIALCAVTVVMSILTAYYSLTKIEIQIDKRSGLPPVDWERARNGYWKAGTTYFDPDGRTRKRCETMEILQEQMLEAAKKRGTR
ncbi:hypothetical protein OESDEN_11860 [Oesophagostomum dentatum]|uniref:Uncharacterized protein n=1 Tax=Oesophagostomum dentatum TaxID=61180 RepID=A0A0B1SXV0_OESDE|nr:hypothetical protein OESDEN_11860 [Oesophagostomum dentatum]